MLVYRYQLVGDSTKKIPILARACAGGGRTSQVVSLLFCVNRLTPKISLYDVHVIFPAPVAALQITAFTPCRHLSGHRLHPLSPPFRSPPSFTPLTHPVLDNRFPNQCHPHVCTAMRAKSVAYGHAGLRKVAIFVSSNPDCASCGSPGRPLLRAQPQSTHASF